MDIIRRYEVSESNAVINAINANADWSAGTYIQNDLVTHNKEIWKCIVTSTTEEPSSVSTDWESQGFSNKWRWEDKRIGTKTTANDEIVLTISNSSFLFNGIAFFGCSGTSVQVIVNDSVDGEVYNHTESLTISENVGDWFDYFFEPYENVEDTAFVDLPSYAGAGVTTTIKITNTGAVAQVGEIVLGTVTNIGNTELPVSSRILDYSIKTTDADGNFIVEEKPFVKTSTYNVSLEASRMAIVQNILTKIRTTPTVFIGDINFKNTIIYGFYKDFSIVFDSYPLASCALEVVGLI